MPRHCVYLSCKPRNPESVDDIKAGDDDINWNARRQMHHALGFDPVMARVAESPVPLLRLRFDSHWFNT